MKRMVTIGCFLIASLVMQNTCLAKEFRINYDIKNKQVNVGQDGKKDEIEFRSKTTVCLTDRYFSVIDGPVRSIYDFEKLRITFINDQTKEYSDLSLFSIVGFRGMEFQNRLLLADIFNKALNKSAETSGQGKRVYDIETLFAIEKPGSEKIKISEKTNNNRLTYEFENEPVVECLLSNTALSGAQKQLFERYLIYCCFMHPQVRRSIMAKDKLPRYLKYMIKGEAGEVTTVEMTLARAGYEDIDSRVIPPDYKRVYKTSSEELNPIVTTVMEKTNPIKRLEPADYIVMAKDLTNKKSYFDANLALLECGLQTGENMNKEIKAVMDAGGKDDFRTTAFFNAAKTIDKETTEKNQRILENIKRDGLTRGHVIDIMIADNKMFSQDMAEAQRMFLSVLKINPYIAGVYNDLGDTYVSSYDTFSGWQCWDTARFLCPNHPMLVQITEYENRLKANYSDFFL